MAGHGAVATAAQVDAKDDDAPWVQVVPRRRRRRGGPPPPAPATGPGSGAGRGPQGQTAGRVPPAAAPAGTDRARHPAWGCSCGCADNWAKRSVCRACGAAGPRASAGAGGAPRPAVGVPIARSGPPRVRGAAAPAPAARGAAGGGKASPPPAVVDALLARLAALEARFDAIAPAGPAGPSSGAAPPDAAAAAVPDDAMGDDAQLAPESDRMATLRADIRCLEQMSPGSGRERLLEEARGELAALLDARRAALPPAVRCRQLEAVVARRLKAAARQRAQQAAARAAADAAAAEAAAAGARADEIESEILALRAELAAAAARLPTADEAAARECASAAPVAAGAFGPAAFVAAAAPLAAARGPEAAAALRLVAELLGCHAPPDLGGVVPAPLGGAGLPPVSWPDGRHSPPGPERAAPSTPGAAALAASAALAEPGAGGSESPAAGAAATDPEAPPAAARRRSRPDTRSVRPRVASPTAAGREALTAGGLAR